MDGKKSYDFIGKCFGYKVFLMSISERKNEVEFILYDAFNVVCGVGEECNSFYAKINIGNVYIDEFLGTKCSSSVEEEDILRSLADIDRYCRLRLPDKYLLEFEKANKR